MTPYQLVGKIRDLLAAAVWPGGEVVFASVHASPRGFEDAVKNLRLPCAFVQAGAATADPDEPALVNQTVSVLVIDAVGGDAIGENVLMGANKSGGATKSLGRGLLELQDRVKAAVKKLGAVDGVRLMFVSSTDAAAVPNDVAQFAAYQEHTFSAWCTTFED